MKLQTLLFFALQALALSAAPLSVEYLAPNDQKIIYPKTLTPGQFYYFNAKNDPSAFSQAKDAQFISITGLSLPRKNLDPKQPEDPFLYQYKTRVNLRTAIPLPEAKSKIKISFDALTQEEPIDTEWLNPEENQIKPQRIPPSLEIRFAQNEIPREGPEIQMPISNKWKHYQIEIPLPENTHYLVLTWYTCTKQSLSIQNFTYQE